MKNAFMVGGMVVAWAIYYAVSKLMVSLTGSPYMAGLLLRSAALVFLTAQLVLFGDFKRLFRQKNALWILLLIGLFGFLLDLFANLGYMKGSLSTGTALLKTDVLMVNLATVIIYKKRLYASDWLGTGIMLVGVLMVLGISFRGISFNAYDLFFLASAACVTANAFIIKSAQEKYGKDADTISYYNNFIVLTLFGASALLGGDIHIPDGAGLGFWGLVILGGLGQTFIYYFYYRNLRHYEVWLVKLYLLLMPILSCFIGVLFLNESLNAEKILGIFVVLCGAAVILLRSRLHHEGGAENASNR